MKVCRRRGRWVEGVEGKEVDVEKKETGIITKKNRFFSSSPLTLPLSSLPFVSPMFALSIFHHFFRLYPFIPLACGCINWGRSSSVRRGFFIQKRWLEPPTHTNFRGLMRTSSILFKNQQKKIGNPTVHTKWGVLATTLV